MTRSTRVRWVGGEAGMGEVRIVHNIEFENLKVRDSLKDQGVDGRIMLKRI
jgi:hypothetical protein